VSELLRERSLAVWLYALPQACVGRIDVQTRPLLSRCEDPQQAAAAVAEQRKFMYAKTAHLLVNATHRSAAQVSQLIYDEISTTIPR
jgi:shikimate kinase